MTAAAAVHPCLQAVLARLDPKDAKTGEPLNARNPQVDVAKNAGLNFAAAVEPSHLFIVRCNTKREETLHEVPEGPLLFVKSYNENTQTVVLWRKVFNELTEKKEDHEVTWTGVPASWLTVTHDSKEYKDGIEAVRARLAKAKLENKGKAANKPDLEIDFTNIRSVLMPGDMNLTMRSPLGQLAFYGRGDLMHGNNKDAPENAKRKFQKDKTKEVEFVATIKADAWQKEPTANVGNQDKAMLNFMAHEDIMSCWYAQWMFQLGLSKYSNDVRREAKDKFAENWKNREDAYKLTGMSEKKLAAEKKKYEADCPPKEVDMLREMEMRHMSESSGITYDYDRVPTGRHNKNGEIKAKFPKAYTERLAVSAKLYKKPTEEQKKALQDHPYVSQSEKQYKEREAAMLKLPFGERSPLCHFFDGHVCELCKGIWIKEQMVRHGVRCFRMGYVDSKTKKPVPKREMTVAEAAEWAQSNAVACLEYSRSLSLDCNMGTMGSKGTLGSILFYRKPPPFQAVQSRPVDRTEDVVIGADEDDDETPAAPPSTPEKPAAAAAPEETKSGSKRKTPSSKDEADQPAAKKAKTAPAEKKKAKPVEEEEPIADFEDN